MTFLPPSFTPATLPPPPPPTNSDSLPASLTPYPLACLPHCLPHFPTSFTPSLSLALSYITLCLTDSPVLLPLPHSLPHSLSYSLPYITLPHTSLLNPLPPSFTFSSLSHCLTFPSLTFLLYSLPQSLPCLPHSLFLHSVIASLPPNSFLPYSLPQSLTAFLTYCLFYSTFIHSLTH